MASKRSLKKFIKSFSFELILSCLFNSEESKHNEEKIQKLIGEISDFEREYTLRAQYAPTSKNDTKKYFKAFYKDFEESANALINKINATE